MLTSILLSLAAASAPQTFVGTDAYVWRGDSIIQGEFAAVAVSSYEIRSNYHGRPGFFMPVDQVWKRKNDLAAYPLLKSDNKMHQAIYNMGRDGECRGA